MNRSELSRPLAAAEIEVLRGQLWKADADTLDPAQAREVIRTLQAQLRTVLGMGEHIAVEMERAGRLGARHEKIMRRWAKSVAKHKQTLLAD